MSSDYRFAEYIYFYRSPQMLLTDLIVLAVLKNILVQVLLLLWRQELLLLSYRLILV